MLLIDELLLSNNYFGRNMHKMRYFLLKKNRWGIPAIPPSFENSYLRHWTVQLKKRTRCIYGRPVQNQPFIIYFVLRWNV